MLLFAHLGLTLAAGRFFAKADLAFLALGSLLPDLIDKPLGWLVYGTPSMGRIYAHTLLFLMLLMVLAVVSWDIRLASLSGGVLAHLILDSMWNSPTTLFWPLRGPFPVVAEQLNTNDYIRQLLMGLHDPWISVPELLGLAYLLYFAVQHKSRVFAGVKKLTGIEVPLGRQL